MVKTKKLISWAVTVQLICIFVFAFAKNWFSYYVAPLNHCRKNNDMLHKFADDEVMKSKICMMRTTTAQFGLCILAVLSVPI